MNLRFYTALILVTLTGFIALSYEICWIRLYSFTSGSRAWVFGAMLSTYLIGLALGSLWSLRYQDSKNGSNLAHLRALSWFVLFANIFGFLLIPMVSHLVPFFGGILVKLDSWSLYHFCYIITLPLVGIGAALLGATFPLICHFAIEPDAKAGARLSYLYLANIIGCGAGSLLTGFVLMDKLSIGGICLLLLSLGLLLSIGLAAYSQRHMKTLVTQILAAIVIGGGIALFTGPLFDGVYERLQWKHRYVEKGPFKLIVESRFGVITVDQEEIIYGGGIYDGHLDTTDVTKDPLLLRPYFISAVHEAPKEVLVIGLSGGLWTQILASNPHVEKVVAIEINGAYEDEVIPEFDSVRSILDNPKLEFVTDDGRRWFRIHKDRKFDVIVANSTFHFREHATNLLSKEFMEQVNDHLKPGGIYLFNTTGSRRAMLTATEEFADTHLIHNNIIASNQPIVVNKERWQRTLEKYVIDGEALFDLNSEESRAKLKEVVSIIDGLNDIEETDVKRLWTEDVMLKYLHDHADETAKAEIIITDDNLGHEFPYLPSFLKRIF